MLVVKLFLAIWMRTYFKWLHIERVINYRANPIEKYDEDFIEKLKLKMPEIAYIYSQNSALTF